MAPIVSAIDLAVQDGKCPVCNLPAQRTRWQSFASFSPSRSYGLAPVVSTAAVEIETVWTCVPCALEFDTTEAQNDPKSRRLKSAQTINPTPHFGALAALQGLLVVDEPDPVPAAEPPPVISGSVIGYRAWRIVDWQLTGTGVNRSWVPGVNEATCDGGHGSYFVGGHPAPSSGCHCGITALARFTEKDEHWQNVDVFGAIEAWGENEAHVDAAKPGDMAAATGVVEKPVVDHGSGFHLHRNGFRARYGKVVLLAVEDDWPVAKKAAVRALAHEHEADVCKRAHLEDAAKEHGQLVPDELLEWVAKTEPASPEMYGYSLLASHVQKLTVQHQQLSNAWAHSLAEHPKSPGTRRVDDDRKFVVLRLGLRTPEEQAAQARHQPDARLPRTASQPDGEVIEGSADEGLQGA